jgi:pectate lyase
MKKFVSFSLMLALMSGMSMQAQTDYATAKDKNKNQAVLKLKDGTEKYYNTESVSSIDFEGANVTVSQSAGAYTYQGTVETIAFNKAEKTDPSGDIQNPEGAVQITEAKGWLESAYVKFALLEGAKSYRVYVKGGQYADYTKIDDQLVRNYGSYGRADAVGLKAGSYAMKVVPLNAAGTELTAHASEATGMTVQSYSREGFAFKGRIPGAYNADGTLKSGAKVIYVTKHNFNTIQLEVAKDAKGNKETYTGLGEIFKALQKGYSDSPLAVRIVGEISASDATAAQLLSDENGLQLKGNNESIVMNVTLEGVGDDATFNGFGMTFYNGTSVEMRNIGLVNFNDDGIQIKGTQYAWIHHNDFFYGNAGSAADQKKGDGSLDVKDDSRYCTFSYNHFWDSGKTSLCGMKSESGPNYISYDHNWFDHSDSRHPRVRTMSVHVWNNYYDGVSKIGVGAVKGANVFVESNYFRNSKNPMLISEQGTDGRDGFADDHDGGMIKAYGNVLTGKSLTTFISHQQNATEFDAYVAGTRHEKVPDSYKSVVGSYVYSNFDTDASLMYTYHPDAAESVPEIVTGYYGAGRMNHGDLQWTFNNSVDDTKDAVDDAMKAAVTAYKTTLVGIFGDENAQSGEQGSEQGGNEQGGQGETPAPEGVILASFDGTPSNSMFTVGGSYGDGKITYNGTYYKKGVKLDSKGSITFTPAKDYQMTLVLGTAKPATDVKVNGEVTTVTGTANAEGKYYELEPIAIQKGTQYVITKGSQEGLVMLIKLDPTAE